MLQQNTWTTEFIISFLKSVKVINTFFKTLFKMEPSGLINWNSVSIAKQLGSMFVQASSPLLFPNYSTALDMVARKKDFKVGICDEHFETLSVQKKAFFHPMNVQKCCSRWQNKSKQNILRLLGRNVLSPK